MSQLTLAKGYLACLSLRHLALPALYSSTKEAAISQLTLAGSLYASSPSLPACRPPWQALLY